MKELIKEFKSKKKEFQEKMQTEFKKSVAEYFKKYPIVEGIVWSQYTPYFNDGDECVFRVGDPNLVLKEEAYEAFPEDQKEFFYQEDYHFKKLDLDNKGLVGISISYRAKDSEFIKDTNEVFSLWNSDIDDIFKAMFDDHVCVYLKNNGEVVVQDIDHD